MSSTRPIVAVSATAHSTHAQPQVRLNLAYTRALEHAGIIPLVNPPLDPAHADALVARVDGVVLTGGADVAASLYGQTPHPAAEPPNGARDRWECALVLAALRHRTPLLAICRGVQVANVALGGTLIQDIAAQVPGAGVHTREDVRTTRVHPIAVTSGSRLALALGATHLPVNSIHHQAIAQPAPGLTVVARADDGVIEGAEWTNDDWWMVGVQWHPEELHASPEPWDRALFAAFAAAIHKYR